jgi:hypothetical protein
VRAFKRFTAAAFTAAVLTIPLTAVNAAAAVKPHQVDPPSGATPWSDCFYGHPLPSKNAYVDSYGNDHLGVGITLRCCDIERGILDQPAHSERMHHQRR